MSRIRFYCIKSRKKRKLLCPERKLIGISQAIKSSMIAF